MDIFFNLKIFYTTLHIIGVAIGAGGAFAADRIFWESVRDKKITATEKRFLILASSSVWIGLTILVISGIGLFLTDPNYYIGSSKFLAKISVVGVIILNGIYFHLKHIPSLLANRAVTNVAIFVSGGISSASWIYAIILGSLHRVPYSYIEIMAVYLGALVASIAVAQIARHYLVLRYR